jgi:glycosyltransferase involved in cell wall biosynthesis
MQPKSICVLVFSNIINDPRVMRQCEAFHTAGWHVVAIGLANGDVAHLPWNIVLINQDRPRSGIVRKAVSRLMRLAYLLWMYIERNRAVHFYWSSWWAFAPELRAFYEAAKERPSDVWLANDWNMLPVAARMAREYGGVYTYDSHEFAAAEFPESWRWRIVRRPMIKALERLYVKGASVVSTVSPGISSRLQGQYELACPPLVIRNTPPYQRAEFRATGKQVKVLYHGGLAPYRGLEQIIDSVLWWREEFVLAIRGVGCSEYIDRLQRRVGRLGLVHRIQFLPPVGMKDLVQEAQGFDIGLHALPQTSTNNRLALPNKFFEYVMAGLALCITDSEEMSALIRKHGLGIVFPAATADRIAQAINSFNSEVIDDCKRNALLAARELNWERESQAMVRAYGALVKEGSS